jgi:hypothetical protein
MSSLRDSFFAFYVYVVVIPDDSFPILRNSSSSLQPVVRRHRRQKSEASSKQGDLESYGKLLKDDDRDQREGKAYDKTNYDRIKQQRERQVPFH